MSHAGAFFLGLGVGAATLVVVMAWGVWRLRNGRKARSRAYGLAVMAVMLAPPVVLAISMPDFKTALLAWFGFPIGMVVARGLTTPLWYFAAQRIERRLNQQA
jgi:cell division protein FtsW (lipid II flippase)